MTAGHMTFCVYEINKITIRNVPCSEKDTLWIVELCWLSMTYSATRNVALSTKDIYNKI